MAYNNLARRPMITLMIFAPKYQLRYRLPKIQSAHRTCLFVKIQWLIVLALAFGPRAFAQQQSWSMGFWSPFGTVGPVSDIDWDALTHVIQVGVEPQSDGSLKFTDPA